MIHSPSNLLKLINEIEEKFPVDEWCIYGIHIWPVIRIQLYYSILRAAILDKKNNKLKNSHSHFNKWSGYFRRLTQISKSFAKFGYAYFADYKKNSCPDTSADTIFLSDGTSYSLLNGVWYEKFCDPFISQFKNKNISFFVMSPKPKYFIPRHSCSMFTQPYLDLDFLAIAIKSKLFKNNSNVTQEQLVKFEQFINFIKSKSLQPPDLKEIRKYIFEIRRLSEFYQGILKKVNPSVAFVVSYYEANGMSLILACRELNIPIVDIQHGFQGDLHVAYGRWNKVPNKGYELLPSLFWCWSHLEASAIERWNNHVSQWHKPIVGGNLGMLQWQKGKDDFIASYDQKITALKVKISSKNDIHILVTLQAEIVYSASFKPVLQAIKNSKTTWHWWFRLHPGIMLKEGRKVKRMLRENHISIFELDAATDLPLYALLRHIDIHLTHSSSTIIEAESFGIPSVITSKMDVEFFPNQVTSGWALPAYTAEDIINAIQVQIDKKEQLNHNKENSKTSKNEGLEFLLKKGTTK